MYLKITNGRVEYLDKTVLEQIDIEIKDKERIGIVGRNGSGKSTLLKAIIDNSLLSEGIGKEKFNIFKSGTFKIGYLNQTSQLDENKTLIMEILDVYQELVDLENKIRKCEETLSIKACDKTFMDLEKYQEKYKLNGGYEYKKEYTKALKKLGFLERDYDKLIKNFSGGEKTKIAFLKLLLSKPDLLILDEPTNHLDIEAILWLEEYLSKYPKSLVLVSHDRMFLDKIATKIYEIEYGKTECYHGNYSYYEKEKKVHYIASLKDYEYQEKEIKRLEDIARRFKYKPSKASMAMAKLKQIERMVKLSKPEKEDLHTFKFKFKDFKESGKSVLKVKDLIVGYDSPINTINFELIKARRLGIIGENGSGKSTLLKTLVKKIKAYGGIFEYGHNVTVGYFDQELNTLDKNLSIYEEYQKKFPLLNDFEIRRNLASFMFYKEDLPKKIEVLSGGEKVRLQLCEILSNNPNLLILDEATNHLDILAKKALEEILIEYPGTILFVSHDRYFIKNIADSLLVFENKEVNYYDLTYDEYLIKTKEIKKMNNKVEMEVKSNVKNNKTNDKKKEIKKLEKKISEKEEKIKGLEENLYLEEVYTDYQKVTQITEDLIKLNNELNDLLIKWEEYLD